MRPVLELISRVGPSDANVLITGENGTGKGIVAQALHAVSGRAGKAAGHGQRRRPLRRRLRERAVRPRQGRLHRRQDRSRRPVRAGRRRHAVPRRDRQRAAEPAAEAAARARDRRVRARRLLAHAPRRRAHPLGHQRRICGEEVAAGRFRQDLLFRLNTIEIHLPPLRERREDIPALATHFLRDARAALPQESHRLRAARRCRRCSTILARQRPRARSRGRARRADGAGHAIRLGELDLRTARGARSARRARGHEPRRRRRRS